MVANGSFHVKKLVLFSLVLIRFLDDESHLHNFYELDRRDQFSIPVDAMTMLYPRFRKTSTTAGTTNYDFQLAIQYRIVK